MAEEKAEPVPVPLWLPFFGLTVLALCLLSDFASLLAKLYVDSLIIGVSASKTKIFWLYFTLSTALCIVWHGKGRRMPSAVSQFFLLNGILMALGLAQQVWLCRSLGLSPYENLFFVQNSDFAESGLHSIHLPKACLGQWFGEVNHLFDVGVPFLGSFPRWVFLLQFLLFSAMVTSYLLSLSEAIHWSPTRLGIWIICGFILMIHSIDGGVFSPQYCVAAALACLVWRARWWPLALALSFLWLLTAGYYGNYFFKDRALRFLFALGSLGFTAMSLRSKRWQSKVSSLVLLLLVLAALPSLKSHLMPASRESGWAWYQLSYALESLQKHQIVHILRQGEVLDQPAFQVLDRWREGPHTLARVRILEDTRIGSLCHSLGLNLYRRPVVVRAHSPQTIQADILEENGFVPKSVPLMPGCPINFAVARLCSGPRILKGVRFQRE